MLNMKEKIGKILFAIVAIIQTILHYLGLLGIVLGIIALIFRNTDRGIELIVGGVSFIIIKYLIGILFHLINWVFKLSYERKN